MVVVVVMMVSLVWIRRVDPTDLVFVFFSPMGLRLRWRLVRLLLRREVRRVPAEPVQLFALVGLVSVVDVVGGGSSGLVVVSGHRLRSQGRILLVLVPPRSLDALPDRVVVSPGSDGRSQSVLLRANAAKGGQGVGLPVNIGVLAQN